MGVSKMARSMRVAVSIIWGVSFSNRGNRALFEKEEASLPWISMVEEVIYRWITILVGVGEVVGCRDWEGLVYWASSLMDWVEPDRSCWGVMDVNSMVWGEDRVLLGVLGDSGDVGAWMEIGELVGRLLILLVKMVERKPGLIVILIVHGSFWVIVALSRRALDWCLASCLRMLGV